jgi:serine/threonine protein kinase
VEGSPPAAASHPPLPATRRCQHPQISYRHTRMNPLLDIPELSNRIYQISKTYTPSSKKTRIPPPNDVHIGFIRNLLLNRIASTATYWKPAHLRMEPAEEFAKCMESAKDGALGSGYYGSVFKIKPSACSCLKNIPAGVPFVGMKSESLKSTYDKFQSPQRVATAIKISKLAGKHGFGPAFYDSFISTDTEGNVRIVKVYELIDGDAWASMDWESPEKKLDALQQLERLIRQMNKVGIIHHDLHPWNIMVSKTGKVYIIDYDRSSFYKDAEEWQLHIFNQSDQLERDAAGVLSETGITYIYNTLVKEGTLVPPRMVISAGKTRKAKRS